MEYRLERYEDYTQLKEMIEKLESTPAPNLSFNTRERMTVYNWLKELELYRKIGTLKEVHI